MWLQLTRWSRKTGVEMRPSDRIHCFRFPCVDVAHDSFGVPAVEIDPERVSVVLISECAPVAPGDSYYAGPDSLFARTTVQAFKDAGAAVDSVPDIVALGVYLTTAVKCAKTAYGIETGTVGQCSALLSQELTLFPNVKAYLLMGDVAIRAFNNVATATERRRVIPAGATYKIRAGEYRYRGARVFPSYLQAGPSFFIEKVKRQMIAQDIAAALALR